MTAYKLVTIDAPYWGFGYRLEQALLAVISLGLMHFFNFALLVQIAYLNICTMLLPVYPNRYHISDLGMKHFRL